MVLRALGAGLCGGPGRYLDQGAPLFRELRARARVAQPGLCGPVPGRHRNAEPTLSCGFRDREPGLPIIVDRAAIRVAVNEPAKRRAGLVPPLFAPVLRCENTTRRGLGGLGGTHKQKPRVETRPTDPAAGKRVWRPPVPKVTGSPPWPRLG